WNGKKRNQRGAPFLKENENDENDEQQSLPKSLGDFFDALADGKSRVEGNGVVEVGGETRLGLLHEFSRGVGGIERVGAGQLVNGDDGGRFAIEPATQCVNLSAEFNTSDVFEPDHRAVGICAKDDVAEFGFGHEAA